MNKKTQLYLYNMNPTRTHVYRKRDENEGINNEINLLLQVVLMHWPSKA
jgi:hypothetical protein